ncbi:MAG TPA: hypothetical protein VF157_03315 [Chloroflexota bacterium]
MKLPTLYTGADGLSHFGEEELPDSPTMDANTPLQRVKGIFVRSTSGERSIDWHTAPRRQLVIPLKGTMEIECSDGQTRSFGPGEVFLAGDTSGKGHTTKSAGGKDRETLFIVLEDSTPPR